MEKKIFIAELRAIANLLKDSQGMHQGGHSEGHELARLALKRVLAMIETVEGMA